jgi:hypothetical protein
MPVIVAALSAMIAFVSSAVLILVAIYVWGPRVCFVLFWAGWFLGGLAAYGIARYLGRPIVHRLVRPAALPARRSTMPSNAAPARVPSRIVARACWRDWSPATSHRCSPAWTSGSLRARPWIARGRGSGDTRCTSPRRRPRCRPGWTPACSAWPWTSSSTTRAGTRRPALLWKSPPAPGRPGDADGGGPRPGGAGRNDAAPLRPVLSWRRGSRASRGIWIGALGGGRDRESSPGPNRRRVQRRGRAPDPDRAPGIGRYFNAAPDASRPKPRRMRATCRSETPKA